MKARWFDVYLSLGSNIGNRQKNISNAVKFLKKNPKVQVEKLSSLYETAPIGPPQRKFINAILKIRTSVSPHRLLYFLKSVEQKMGRKKIIHFGPRNIDIDLIFYGKKRIHSKNLQVPHPSFHKRKFVLVPLSEISPTLRPVGFRKTVSQLSDELTDPKQKVKLNRFASSYLSNRIKSL